MLRCPPFDSSINLQSKQWITFHVTPHSNPIKFALPTVLVFRPLRSWFKTTWELFSILYCEQLFQPCSRNGRGVCNGFWARWILNSSHLQQEREGNVWTRHEYRQSDENLCFCFTGAILYLNWVIAKENVRLRRGVKVVEHEEKKQEWELCQTLLKEIHAIKPQNQLIGRCYPWEFITGAWETRHTILPKCLRNQKGHL